jgi:aerobic-type carbon monoxide dehydrogenase small subunit (CoxS/CutS family)
MSPEHERAPQGSLDPVAAVGVAVPGVRIVRARAADDPEAAPFIGPGPVPFELSVNGRKHALELPPATTLAEALHDGLGLTGTKRVCDRGACGACTVMLDGRIIDSCSLLAIDAVGREVVTVEGCGTPEKPSPVQAAFVSCDALQCGYCTPGMVVSCTALLARVPNPSRAEIAEGIAGNICRCGTYANIFEAVARAANGGGR